MRIFTQTWKLSFQVSFQILKILILSLLVAGGFFAVAKTASAATEFVSIIDPGNGAGTDYTALNDWENAVQVDLTAATTLVFSYTPATASGTIPDNVTVQGQLSGAIATLVHQTATSASAQILLKSISGGPFQSGEQVYLQSTGASSTYVVLSNTGDSAIAVASVRSSNGAADQTAVTIDGWTTSATNYIKVYTTAAARHNGKWDDTKYRLETTQVDSLVISEDFVRIEGLQLEDTLTSCTTCDAITVGNINNPSNIKISENIVKGVLSGSSSGWGIAIADSDANVYIWNNIVYDFINGSNGRGISSNLSLGVYIYNNTVYNSATGIYRNSGTVYAKNNISYNNTDNYGGSFDSGSTNNLSGPSQTDAPGSNPVNAATVSFLDEANDDYHLSPADTAARNAGTSTILWDANLSFTQDIDGSYRGAAWDIGADEVPTEFVSTICESTSAGGDCANRDYSTLSAWEAAVDSNLTASGTRVFSGTASGTVSASAVTLYDESGASTGITGTIVATTSNQILVINIIGTTTPVSVASGSSWRISSSNTWRNSGTADQLGASPIAVAKIDGAWANPDTTAVTVDGWTTSHDNYIKIYTTPLARHSGKWDTVKYRMSLGGQYDTGIYNLEAYVDIIGLQIESTYTGGSWGRYGIWSNSSEPATEFGIDGVIIRNNGSNDGGGGITISDASGYIRNTVIYGSSAKLLYGIYVENNNAGAWVVNNCSVYNTNGASRLGIWMRYSSGHSVENCVSMNNYSSGDINYGTDPRATNNNISSDATADDAGGAGNLINKSAANQFVSLVAGAEDFHVKNESADIYHAGKNLYSVFTVDIDSAARPPAGVGLNWDIGADQTAVKIYRSIAPSATAALTTGASNAVTISSSTSLATFATALADNIGVGDVIIYNTGGTATATAFIHSRSSSTVYTVKTASGTAPTAVSADTTWSIYRSYTTLANAEAGTENTGIANASIRNFDTWSGGADLVASNTQWNIAAYANGATADTVAVTIDGWMTGQQNFIKIYTPTTLSEVGTSQRHQGKWDDNKYRIQNVNTVFYLGGANYVRVDGLQIETITTSSYHGINTYGGTHQVIGSAAMYISNNIITTTGATGYAMQISYAASSTGAYYIYNNIIYNYPTGVYANENDGTVYLYNNTVYNASTWAYVRALNGAVMAKNNISQNSADGFNGSFASGSDYNISDIAGDAPGAHSATATVTFVDAANKDFHLSPTDTMALDMGTTTEILDPGSGPGMTNDYDIDGNYRRQWDIGADEASVEYVTSVMESGGNFSNLSAWESANQVDLATTSTAVFSLSSASGTIPASASVQGLTSGAVASTTVGSVSTSTQILLYNIASSTFLAGERIYIKGGATTSNYAILSNAGNPAIATAKIDGAWTGADTTAVTITGWTTGPTNYIRIYTTPTARHNGKWDDTKYQLSASLQWIKMISITENYVHIDGLQIYNSYPNSDGEPGDIRLYTFDGKIAEVKISNNILRLNSSNTYDASVTAGVAILQSDADYTYKIWNNIIYDTIRAIRTNYNALGTFIVYNNTVYNTRYDGIRFARDGGFGQGFLYLKNNIVQASGDSDYANVQSSGWASSSIANNISDDSTAPGANSRSSTTVAFADAANDDFHLSPTDTAAKDAAADLSADANLIVNTDIEGQARGTSTATTTLGGLGWDVGADEGATIMYRSVGNTSADLNSGAATITISNSAATFSAALPDNVGVGDVVQYGNPLTLAFITGRSSSTVYSVVNATGSYPVATSSAAAAIYRAHTLLNNWNTQTTGTVNPNINAGLRSLVLVSKNLVASNTAMFVAAYASSSPDTYGNTSSISDWTTGTGNYVKVYTPVSASEVGTSQRHAGTWDDGKYRLSLAKSSDDGYYVLRIADSNVWVEGLQVYSESSGLTWQVNGISVNGSLSNVKIGSNIIKGSVQSGTSVGIFSNSGNHYVWNNIVYGFKRAGSNSYGISIGGNVRAYNNTVYDNTRGIVNQGAAPGIVLINNIAQNNSLSDYYDDSGGWATSTDYNIATDATAPGTHSKNLTVVNFLNTATTSTYDLHLAPTDRAARDAGVSLASDPYLSFSVDIDGEARPMNVIWDIGADESVFIPEYQMEGQIQMEGYIKFE